MALVTSKYTQLKTELHGSVVEVNILFGVYSVVVVFPTMYICACYMIIFCWETLGLVKELVGTRQTINVSN